MTAREVREIRESLGLTPAAFSRRLNVEESTVCRWENGQRSVSKPYQTIIRAVSQGIELPTATQP